MRCLLGLAALALLAPAAPAAAQLPADEPLVQLHAGGRIDAFGGVLAWTAWDVGEGRGTLAVRTSPGADPKLLPRRRDETFDVSVGPDRSGRARVTYSREGRARILDPRTMTERRLRRASTPRSILPVIWGDTVAWVRPRRCDEVWVRTGAAAARRVRTGGGCLTIGDLELRDGRLAVRAGVADRLSRQELRLVTLRTSARTDTARTLAVSRWGEEPRPFGPPVLDAAGNVNSTRVGLQQQRFVRISPGGRVLADRPARLGLGGPIALDGGRWWYVALNRTEEACGPLEQLAPVPCLLVAAARSPYAGTRRLLPPELSVSYAPACARPGEPLTVSGRLTRSVIEGFSRREPRGIPDQPVLPLRRTDRPAGPGFTESFDRLAEPVATGADGRWSIRVAAPRKPFFSANSGLLLAGRGTAGYACGRP